jgi:two-component system chemotaxis response regulator CheB
VAETPPLVVVGASAGGVEALRLLARELPGDLPAAVLVVLHVPASWPSELPQVLERAGKLPVEPAEDGQPLHAGRIYVAPPDRHLLVDDGRVELVRGPRENRHRPAIDPLFRSAAVSHGPRVVAVVLTGADDDGAAGAAAVSRHGGRVIVQDPADAAHPVMPRQAILADSPAHIAPLAEIPGLVARLVAELAGKNGAPRDADDLSRQEIRYAMLTTDEHDGPAGQLLPYSCPDCGGTLWHVPDEAVERVRCRTGHAYMLDALVGRQGESVEAALWTAFRALQERASLTGRVARRLRSQGLDASAADFEGRSRAADEQAALVERVLLGRHDRSETDRSARPA